MDWLRRFFTSDVLFKCACVVGAAAIWFFVNEELTDVRALSVPVKVIAPAGRVITPDTLTVNISVRGPRGKVTSLSAREIMAKPVEIPEDVPDGEYRPGITPDIFLLPGGDDIRVVRIESPPPLTVVRQFSKQLRVRVMPRGKPADGMEVIGAEAFPALVTVTGPEAALKGREFIETGPVDIAGRRETVSANVPVVEHIEMPSGQPVRVTCNELVTATVKIAAEPAEKAIADIPVRVVFPAGREVRVTIEPQSVSLRVRGDKDSVVRLVPSDVLLYVDMSASPAGGDAVPVKCVLPAGVTLAKAFAAPTVRVVVSGGGKPPE